MFQQLNSKKAAGPDNISPCLRKQCAGHLSGVFTDIFCVSLSQCKIPLCFKKSTIIPVPKQFTASCLNAYRLVALNSGTYDDTQALSPSVSEINYLSIV
ncbi:hypothetical protein NP493_457g03022 [Ridgeia piscesae]|uniref:Uncharacterized protein n=1 Tax=Ridgeia piscesae TaxID=27915 RepID=A0AAD9KZA9_RIDPI|nr:hypothetical protein NP493_457g03022 [Ridgeia piscesae]